MDCFASCECTLCMTLAMTAYKSGMLSRDKAWGSAFALPHNERSPPAHRAAGQVQGGNASHTAG
jgi:hypothetical protein